MLAAMVVTVTADALMSSAARLEGISVIRRASLLVSKRKHLESGAGNICKHQEGHVGAYGTHLEASAGTVWKQLGGIWNEVGVWNCVSFF